MFEWFCIRTIGRRETVASKALGDRLGLETLAPRVITLQHTKYRTNEVPAPLFPSYIFARFDLAEHGPRVRRSHGVASVVSFNGAPYPVPEVVIGEIRGRICDDGFVVLSEPARRIVERRYEFAPQEPVTVIGGPFEGFEGLFVRDDRQRVVVLMRMLAGDGLREVKLLREDVQPAYAVL